MKTTKRNSATKSTKVITKDVAEKPYSLVGVENMGSVEGLVLQMNHEEAASILKHVRTKYPHLPLGKDVVLRLADERKNAVLLKCEDGALILRRTSDLFQTPTPVLSEAAKERAKAEKKAAAAKSRKAPAAVSKGRATAKGSSMLAKAMDEVKARAKAGKGSARVTGRTPKPKAPKATTPVAPSVPATVAATSSPTTQG